MKNMTATALIAAMRSHCARCNRYKSTMTLEAFRQQIALQIERLEKRSWNYRMARDFRLVEETKKPVVFYFEKKKKEEMY